MPKPKTGDGEEKRSKAVTSTNPDEALMQRFRNSGHATISSLLGAKTVDAITYPKHNGKDACLSWLLKGRCTTGCSRSASHVQPSNTVKVATHQILNDCGVPPSS